MLPKLHRSHRLGALLAAYQTRPATKHSTHKTTLSDLRVRRSGQNARHHARRRHDQHAIDLPQLGPRVHLPSGEPEQCAPFHDETPRRDVPFE